MQPNGGLRYLSLATLGDVNDVVARAQDLLGRTFRVHGVTAVITEVEAYGGITDPASHAFVRTPRSEIMYGPSGRLYVYRIHGHHAANIVTGPQEIAAAVLLRGARIVDGLDLAYQRRGLVPEHQLARGPGNLAKALGITMADRGSDVTEGPAIMLGERAIATEPLTGPRVGVRRAADRPWRLWLPGEPSVSVYRRHPKAEGESDPASDWLHQT